jgi:hypothetical protein
MFKNILLVPQLPDPSLTPIEQLAQLDIKLDASKKREDYTSKTSDRLEKRSNILFSQLRCSAYVGRAWQYLVLYINMPMR